MINRFLILSRPQEFPDGTGLLPRLSSAFDPGLTCGNLWAHHQRKANSHRSTGIVASNACSDPDGSSDRGVERKAFSRGSLSHTSGQGGGTGRLRAETLQDTRLSGVQPLEGRTGFRQQTKRDGTESSATDSLAARRRRDGRPHPRARLGGHAAWSRREMAGSLEGCGRDDAGQPPRRGTCLRARAPPDLQRCRRSPLRRASSRRARPTFARDMARGLRDGGPRLRPGVRGRERALAGPATGRERRAGVRRLPDSGPRRRTGLRRGRRPWSRRPRGGNLSVRRVSNAR